MYTINDENVKKKLMISYALLNLPQDQEILVL